MHPLFKDLQLRWANLSEVENRSFVCGFCGNLVSSTKGLKIIRKDVTFQMGGVFICTNCEFPNFILDDIMQVPKQSIGNSVMHLPEEINTLYEEARKCTSNNCFTASVMLCRKILMNIAVNLGAEENKRFIDYVNYLSDNGYVPPNGKHWVDHIRLKGNEANHEIAIMKEINAKELIIFTEMLLKFIYEFPKMISAPA